MNKEEEVIIFLFYYSKSHILCQFELYKSVDACIRYLFFIWTVHAIWLLWSWVPDIQGLYMHVRFCVYTSTAFHTIFIILCYFLTFNCPLTSMYTYKTIGHIYNRFSWTVAESLTFQMWSTSLYTGQPLPAGSTSHAFTIPMLGANLLLLCSKTFCHLLIPIKTVWCHHLCFSLAINKFLWRIFPNLSKENLNAKWATVQINLSVKG